MLNSGIILTVKADEQEFGLGVMLFIMQDPGRHDSKGARLDRIARRADIGNSASAEIIDKLIAFMLMQLNIGIFGMLRMEKKQQTIHFYPPFRTG
ncbi:hypothetical protein D3C73_1528880 [compost metagenome]